MSRALIARSFFIRSLTAHTPAEMSEGSLLAIPHLVGEPLSGRPGGF